MNETASLRRLLLGGLALALGFYVAVFALDRYWRTRRGPWEVEFGRDSSGAPSLVIRQPRLGIRAFRLVFAGETNDAAAAWVRFETPRQAVPWGRVKHDDLSVLPGVVTLELYGHEVELLPRTIYLNRRAVPWKPDATVVLSAADRPDALPEPQPPRRSFFRR